MFEVTFLGHQGWQFSAAGSTLLLDPLLCDEFGHDPSGHGFDVFPPRRLDFTRCPLVDAVLFSHEHEDHLHIPSLEGLDRSIPIYLSVRSSSAARAIVQDQASPACNRDGRDRWRSAVVPFNRRLAGSHPGWMRWRCISGIAPGTARSSAPSITGRRSPASSACNSIG
jgi:hypothetical protein